MCGIAAIWGRTDPTTIDTILDRLAHRGPDGRGTHEIPAGEGPPATLGHARLAIIDPAGGRQPLVDDDGSALVCNGMLYNDRGLREALAARAFRTASDSESALQGFLEWGPDVARRLDGMFAFVLVGADGTAFAARDPLGIKPLYWGRVDGGLAFASEIKALAGAARDIEEFPPGCTWDSRSGLQRFYEVPSPHALERDTEATCSVLRDTLEQAVRKRLRSDVPLGAFLSGGLDSSIIAALARRHVDELHTFAVGLEGSSDLAAARRVAAHLGTVHHEYVIGPREVVTELPAVLHHLESHDRDLVRSAVPTWFVSRLAATRVKAVLTGEGADELFAGYAYHADYDDGDALQAETRRSLQAMHDVNLQRVDRMTMAHALEARVPFLDTAVVALAMGIPAHHKRRRGAPDRGSKWILRRAFEDLLPEDIVWRGKLQFDEGSGFSDHLAAHARREAAAGRAGPRGTAGTEEGLYRRLLVDGLPEPGPVLALTRHWNEDRVAA
ncbi:MAG: asparagine synthase-related protein [Halofilum sp. (in: g-proteobacteria)]|nr:asparagine synthase-related protein [Halofilum sp. (in: g-proteobacteria)]